MWNRRRAQRAPITLTVLAGDGGVLYRGAVAGMALPEALILALSMEFFGDPAPCQIHRSAVMKRVFLEIEERLAGGETRLLSDLPPECARYFAGYTAATACQLEGGGGR
ncbi:MAG: hypothetical protein GX558_02750 [Clostridiales bacterium]|nr:hypothetical protein [Clostridiales bacterium]